MPLTQDNICNFSQVHMAHNHYQTYTVLTETRMSDIDSEIGHHERETQNASEKLTMIYTAMTQPHNINLYNPPWT